MADDFKTPARPTPNFFQTFECFSTKKNRKAFTERRPKPPRPPLKEFLSNRFFDPDNKFTSSVPTPVADGGENPLRLISTPGYVSDTKSTYFEQCFKDICKLGSGSFGDVYRVRSKINDQLFAVKVMIDRFRGEKDRNRQLQEAVKHRNLPPHRNCVQFFDAWEECGRLYIQLELCQHSLSQLAEVNHDIPEQLIWSYTYDLLRGVSHLHSHSLIHMDIKSPNCFVGLDGHCKLGDFGIMIDMKTFTKKNRLDVTEGDGKYLAPEVLEGNIGFPLDIFSLGLTILEIAVDLDLPQGGETPWQKLRIGELPLDIFAEKQRTMKLQNLIADMLTPDPAKRPSADALIKEYYPTSTIINSNNDYSVYEIFMHIIKLILYLFYLLLTYVRCNGKRSKMAKFSPKSNFVNNNNGRREIVQSVVMTSANYAVASATTINTFTINTTSNLSTTSSSESMHITANHGINLEQGKLLDGVKNDNVDRLNYSAFSDDEDDSTCHDDATATTNSTHSSLSNLINTITTTAKNHLNNINNDNDIQPIAGSPDVPIVNTTPPRSPNVNTFDLDHDDNYLDDIIHYRPPNLRHLSTPKSSKAFTMKIRTPLRNRRRLNMNSFCYSDDSDDSAVGLKLDDIFEGSQKEPHSSSTQLDDSFSMCPSTNDHTPLSSNTPPYNHYNNSDRDDNDPSKLSSSSFFNDGTTDIDVGVTPTGVGGLGRSFIDDDNASLDSPNRDVNIVDNNSSSMIDLGRNEHNDDEKEITDDNNVVVENNGNDDISTFIRKRSRNVSSCSSDSRSSERRNLMKEFDEL